jgi:hypothetical protein
MVEGRGIAHWIAESVKVIMVEKNFGKVEVTEELYVEKRGADVAKKPKSAFLAIKEWSWEKMDARIVISVKNSTR